MPARTERRAIHHGPGLPGIALAVLAGAVLVQGLPVLPPRWLDWLLLIVIPAQAGIHCLLARHRMDSGPRRNDGTKKSPAFVAWTLLALMSAAFGWTALRADLAMQARLPHALEKQDILVTGTVADLPQAQDGSTRFDFDIASAEFEGRVVPLRGHVRLSWYASRQHAAPVMLPCSTWRLRVRMKRPHGLLNPGGMDFERSALQKGIVATGYVRADPANALLAKGACVDGLRAHIAAMIGGALPDDVHAARLLRALSVGDERALDERDWQVVRATGISHLIAISGFHVGLAAVLGAWLVRLAWWLFPSLGLRLARPLAEAAVAFPAALAYGALAGFGLPTTRTLLMIAVVAGWRLLRRGGGFGEGFGLALIVILVVDPLSVLSAGFWLSFAGVALLAWTLARDRGWRGHLKEIGFAPLLMTLALLPLTVWFFGQASLVAPLANLVAVPFVSFVIVPIDLVACALLFAWPFAGRILLHACAHLVDALWWVLQHLAAWPAAMQYLPQASFLAFVLACVGVVWLLAPRGVPARALGALALLPLCWPRTPLPVDGAFRATVIDVGQGLSVLVRTRSHALLVDTGARYPSGFDLGEAAVVPTLHALDVTRLDGLIISHGDNDHSGGAVSVLSAFPGTPAWGGEPARGPVPMRQCGAGQHWRWDGVDFRMLRPPVPVTARGNDAGCVLLVGGAGGRLLLPADTSSQVEPDIARAVPPGPPLVLVAPHHGSKTSSSLEYLEALHPKLAIASTGYLNGYHHPAPEVVERYASLDIPLLNTPDTGAVRIVFPVGAPPRVVSEERIRQARYWREHGTASR
ncbi:MAG TPA: DNA internalization-related competence protein ComEC/Rec2 [Rhodanobacteraceae bacterium]|jgi:competence protein ComEC|nr:DNA internalization-related competence protein ComEC/Rec2 [Rhodanobacteraceae bacterium]